jgi:hypothetical protein
MTPDELGAALVEEFGENLPNPEQEPKRFNYYVKLFLYDKYVKQPPQPN